MIELSPARNGTALIAMANDLLARYAPDTIVPRSKCVGRAAIVYVLHAYGFVGQDFDWRSYEDGWHYVKPSGEGRYREMRLVWDRHQVIGPEPAAFFGPPPW